MSEIQQVPIPAAGGQNDETTPRACQSCRTRKIRCLQDVSSPSEKCLPCAKSNRECVFSARSKTKRRKRTDTRVADLEKEVKAMCALLKKRTLGKVQNSAEAPPELTDGDRRDQRTSERNISGTNDSPMTYETHSILASGSQPPQNSVLIGQNPNHGMPSFEPQKGSRPYSSLPDDSQYPSEMGLRDINHASGTPRHLVEDVDVVGRGLLSMHEASQMYDRYVEELVPQLPIVVLPKAAAEVIRREKPTLFLAVMAAAAGTASEDLYLTLNQEILQVYADKVTIKGEKSLELIQSLMITVVWCCPPDNLDSIKFYQYIHIAATMALDLGIGKKTAAYSKPSEFSVLAETDMFPSDSQDSLPRDRESRSPASAELAESRRTILACYFLCSSVSISLRRPNMLRFSSWMADCMEYLEASPDAAPTDKLLMAWIRFERIMEECANSFSFDDPSAAPSLMEPRTQLMLKGFEKQLETWKTSIAPSIMNHTLYMNFHVNVVFLHEISMYPDHDPEDFRPPYVVKTAMQPSEVSLSPAYIEAIMTCVSSTHIFLNIFLEMDVKTVRATPIFQWVRIIYGAVVLIKLSLSASTPTSEIGKVLDHDSLQVTQYMDRLLVHVMRVLGPEKNRVAATFLTMLMKLKQWYTQHTSKISLQNDDKEVIQPCTYLKSSAIAGENTFYSSVPGSARNTGQEKARKQPMAHITRPGQPFYRIATTDTSQQQSPSPKSHQTDSSNGDNEFTPLVPIASNLEGFGNSQWTNQGNPPTFSFGVDSTGLPTYDDPFSMMDLDLDQLAQNENIDFLPEELDAWINGQGMPGLMPTAPQVLPQQGLREEQSYLSTDG